MRYAFSLTRRAAFGVAAGTLAAGGLLFTAGVLVGASAPAPGEAAARMAASAPADSAGGHSAVSAPAADCPPAPAPAAAPSTAAPSSAAPSASPPASGTGFSSAEFAAGARAPETYRDERRALAALHRYESRGVAAVIEAWVDADGETVFRVVPGAAP